MPLPAGTRLGPYEVLAPLGAGGMGEVYKATDTRLNRTVAIKVLPSHVSAHPEMKQRFEREAQTIAALNHPNICTLHDVGRQGDTDYLVMEFLEGETLAARLERGPLGLDDAVRVAIQIADALEKAHGQGVTHRDLKPGNVMLTDGGAQAKLLDFGLAKLKQAPQASPSGSPITAAPLSATAPGTILGTMQYMAPEQLEGREADARTDLFAFGAVLYEMVTGRRAFQGKSQPHLIAAIISSEPEPVSQAQPAAPPALDFLVARCLVKDPELRLQTATDLLWKLRWIAEGDTDRGVGAQSEHTRHRRTRVAQLAVAVASLVLIVASVIAFVVPAGTEARQVTRFLVEVPDMPVAEAVSISPDGRLIAYSAGEGGSTALFVRPLDTDEGTKLPGTEGAGRLFWSPDSRWIAFFAEGRLKRIEAAGGPPQNIAETPDLLGGTWNEEGVILFGSSRGLQRVLAAGGQPSVIELPEEVAEARPREPYFLPDGRHYLYLAGDSADAGAQSRTSGAGSPAADAASPEPEARPAPAIYAGSLDSTEATRVVASESNAVYAEPGYLLYHRDGTLYAQEFDASDLEVRGEAVRLADGIPFGETGAAAFAASHTGVLLYRNSPPLASPSRGAPAAAASVVGDRPIQWVSRTGRGESASEPAEWNGVDLSPDGKRAAVHRHEAPGGDVWIFEAGQTTPSKFTFDAAQDNSSPVWSPDGSRIAFSSRRDARFGLYVKLADNSRAEELVIESDLPVVPMSWSGDRLVYWTADPRTAGDIWVVQPTGGAKSSPLLQTRFDERNPQVSPDGRWMAYSSNETGRSEIYIRPFPDGEGRIQVSVNGGVFPRWRRDGRELYFMSLVSLGAVMASDIRVTGAAVQREVPRPLFQSTFVGNTHTGGQSHAYAVSADGQRFLIPQFDGLARIGGPGRGGRGAVMTVALEAVAADRRGQTAARTRSAAPITVVLDWTLTLSQ
jgi:Tol biopolymer transport system component